MPVGDAEVQEVQRYSVTRESEGQVLWSEKVEINVVVENVSLVYGTKPMTQVHQHEAPESLTQEGPQRDRRLSLGTRSL